MADILVEFAAETSRFKRDLGDIERDAKRTAVSIARSFRDAEARGFATDFRTQRAQRLAAEREINQRVEADRLDTMRRSIDAELEGQRRLAQRTRVYTERRRAEWEEAERRRSRATERNRQIVGQALTAAAAGLRIGVQLAEAYAGKWEYAGSMMERASRSAATLKDRVGRELVLAFDALAPSVGVLDEIRGRLVDTVANLANLDSMHSARVDAALDAAETQEVSARQRAAFRAESLQLAAKGEGPDAEAARRELERMAYVRRLNGLVEAGQLSGDDASTLAARFAASQRAGASPDDSSAEAADRRALLEITQVGLDAQNARARAAGRDPAAAQARQRAALDIQRLDPGLDPERRRQAIDAINERRDAELAEIASRQEAERAAHEEDVRRNLEGYRLRAEEFEIDQMVAAGRQREAELAREKLRLQREVLEIKRDELLTDEQRERLTREATERSEAVQERIAGGREFGATRSIASGVGGDPLLRRQVLGAGVNVAQMQLKEAKTANRHLAAIEDRVGVYA